MGAYVHDGNSCIGCQRLGDFPKRCNACQNLKTLPEIVDQACRAERYYENKIVELEKAHKEDKAHCLATHDSEMEEIREQRNLAENELARLRYRSTQPTVDMHFYEWMDECKPVTPEREDWEPKAWLMMGFQAGRLLFGEQMTETEKDTDA